MKRNIFSKSYLKSEEEIPGVKQGFFARLGLDVDVLIGGFSELLLVLLSIGAVLYFGQYLYSTLSAGVSVSSISSISETVSVEGTAFLIRDEKPLFSQGDYHLFYKVPDGARVQKEEVLVGGYRKEIEGNVRELQRVQAEEALLARSLSVHGVLDTLEEAASGYEDLMALAAAGDWHGYCALSDSFREQLNRSSVYSGTASSISRQFQALQKQEADIIASIGKADKEIKASAPGYYFYEGDGYENLVSTDLIRGFTEETYAQLLAMQPEDTKGRCGVFVADQKWYLAVECKGFALEDAKTGSTLRVRFPASEDRELEMTVQTAIRAQKGMLLLLGADVIPAGFTWERIRTVKIVCEEVSGYRIPATALHTEDGITGVYVLQGKTVCFRRIEVLYEGTGYCVVAPREESTPQPKTYRVIAYPSTSSPEDFSGALDFAASRGVSGVAGYREGNLGGDGQTVNRLLFLRTKNRRTPLSYLDTSPYYAYLDGLESVVIAGRDLYHGKVVG